MRARYYSPELRRFINADVIAGEISNAVTLNRYAYANGNPVSNIDPLGLSADERVFDKDSLFNIMANMSKTHDQSLASELLTLTINQLLNFKNIFAVSTEASFKIPVGNGATIFYSNSVKSGSGNLEVSSVISDQLELLGSMSFSLSDNMKVLIKGETGFEVEYSNQVDDYTTVAVSMSGMINTLSATYTVTTTDTYDNSVSTSVGFMVSKNNSAPSTTMVPIPIPEKEPVPEFAPELVPQIMQPEVGPFEIFVGALILAYTLSNDVTGLGVADDPVLIPLGLKLMGF